jgi:hypothetical protein
MSEQPAGHPDVDPQPSSGDWVRGLLIVIAVTVVLAGGGIWVIANVWGGCGTVQPCS